MILFILEIMMLLGFSYNVYGGEYQLALICLGMAIYLKMNVLIKMWEGD